MELKRIEIKNFRSIDDIMVEFNHRCRVLVGINESGKSNILRALSMLSSDINPTNEDLREILPTEKPIDKAYVKFIFELEEKEISKIYESLKLKLLVNNENAPILEKDGKKINLRKFCYLKNEGLFTIDVKDKDKYATYYLLNKNYTILNNWRKINENCPAGILVTNQKGENISIKKYNFINVDEFKEIPQEHLEKIKTEDINDFIGEEIVQIINNNLPNVIFWKYDENKLLPPTINLDNFASNPNTCITLKNMFILAGITDIAEEINAAKQGVKSALRNLLNRVANQTTIHFRNVWKEYDSIEFLLEPNGNNIDANIKEENRFPLSQRSDGFKRFVSFLLQISTQAKTNQIKDVLLLIDETDQSLHPSSTEYLRDELIKISKNNHVVYSTHSIFMIDSREISRHIIVKKKKEKTYIEDANESNIFDEEVLFNALGYSVFKTLKEKNIIFEGWRDKKLFMVAIDKMPKKFKKMNKKLSDVGICHALGAKNIKNITPLFETAKRKCLIVSDCDDPAKQCQSEYQKLRGYGIWKRYDEIFTQKKVITGEDFIKIDKIGNGIEEIRKKYSHLKTEPNFNDEGGIINSIKKWLKSNKLQNEDIKIIMDEFKDIIFEDLKQKNIEESYYDFLISLNNLLEKL